MVGSILGHPTLRKLLLKIANIIKERIKNGTLKNGEALPSQKELSQIFSTSIMTARHALGILEEEGIISVVHGVGTFVSAPEYNTDEIGLQGFQNEMDRQKLSIQTAILEKKHDVVRSDLNDVFSRKDITFSCLVRQRTLEGRPIILQRSWVASGNRAVVEEYTEDKSLYSFFTDKTDIMIVKGKELVSPILLDGDEMSLLELDKPCTAFYSSRVSLNLNDEIVLFDEAFLPGQHVIMASISQGRNNKFKYIINKEGPRELYDSFNDPELWEDLL